ncbi:predicted protein [Nematostella vectensis]|uniref:Ig-like domain-containing protein n=1 Tax=Nematostella vectensis TaxID=45351 RepID=A7SPS5_NEMVE|nr:predicted protein [Nematostella vectensis]|eukprot:XP_001626404.1 predicted protein [Nematostella vectensis]
MTISTSCLVYVLLVFISLASHARGAIRIIKPWPDNVYPIEGENTAVTCVAFDKNDASSRPVIKFVQTLDLGGTKQITDEGPNGHTYFTTKKAMDGRKVSTTLHIKNVTLNDDTKNGGRYLCEAYNASGDDPWALAKDTFGFMVTVIERSEIPTIQVSEGETVKFGESINLGCNVTMGSNSLWNSIDHSAWIKDDKVIDETLCPDRDKLDNLVIKIDKPEKAGVYTCVLTAKLRNTRPYKIYGNITIQVTPRFTKVQMTALEFESGGQAEMQCSAEGNPIDIIWKTKTAQTGGKTEVLNQTAVASRFTFSKASPYSGFNLSIDPLEDEDRGLYYCCIRNDNSSTEDTSSCQEFVLVSTCPGSKYECRDGTCIDRNEHCNGKIDCPDASDEKGCGLLIAWPYPPNVWGMVGDSVQIPCTARNDGTYPAVVKFKRRDSLYQYVDIPNTARVYQTNSTANKSIGLTRTTVLHIHNMTVDDDSNVYRYICSASTPGAQGEQQQGFQVIVVKDEDLPRADVNSVNANFGETVNLTCKLTFTGTTGQVSITSLHWMRDNKVIANGTDTGIGPYTIRSVSTKDGGDYKCLAKVEIRSSKEYQTLLGTAKLTVFVKFFGVQSEIIGSVGERVILECPAEGYPLKIQWSRKTGPSTETMLKDTAGKYSITRPCEYCRYTLTILDLSLQDFGVYICTAATGSAGSGSHNFVLSLSESGPSTPTAGGNSTEPTTESSASTASRVTSLLLVCLCLIGLM